VETFPSPSSKHLALPRPGGGGSAVESLAGHPVQPAVGTSRVGGKGARATPPSHKDGSAKGPGKAWEDTSVDSWAERNDRAPVSTGYARRSTGVPSWSVSTCVQCGA
jgi:hypothetical protein